MRFVFILLITLLFTDLMGQDLSGLYQKVSPGVVMIFTEEKGISEVEGTTVQTKSQGLGSGFLISDRLVMTAAHVVNVPESVKVRFVDGEVIPARVTLSHKRADVAVIELIWPRKNAVTLTLGDSDKLVTGNQVFIIGAPYGLGQSLSAGHISGFHRPEENRNSFWMYEFVQTDAAINTGNSGGPMFNMQGEVVGIVSHITTVSGGFQGIGFAATANIARYLLLEKKTPWSGADLFVLTGEMARAFNLPQSSGLLVQRVVFSSPLGIKGVRGGKAQEVINGQKLITGGDIILAVNDIPFDVTDQALERLSALSQQPGFKENFRLTVLRDGKIVKLGGN